MTKKVRIAVAIDEHGNYSCAGWLTDDCDEVLAETALENLHIQENPVGASEQVVIVEADIPLPKRQVIAGTVKGTVSVQES